MTSALNQRVKILYLSLYSKIATGAALDQISAPAEISAKNS